MDVKTVDEPFRLADRSHVLAGRRTDGLGNGQACRRNDGLPLKHWQTDNSSGGRIRVLADGRTGGWTGLTNRRQARLQNG